MALKLCYLFRNKSPKTAGPDKQWEKSRDFFWIATFFSSSANMPVTLITKDKPTTWEPDKQTKVDQINERLKAFTIHKRECNENKKANQEKMDKLNTEIATIKKHMGGRIKQLQTMRSA